MEWDRNNGGVNVDEMKTRMVNTNEREVIRMDANGEHE